MRAPQATGAPSPQGPRNEGEIQQAANWQSTMYGSHGMAFGNNPSVLRQMASSGGGQKTSHPDATNEGAFNTHGEHGDRSLGSSTGAGQVAVTTDNDLYAKGYPRQDSPSVDYKKV